VAKIVHHRERFSEVVRGAGPATPDDVTILTDGRRLDTPEKVRAFVVEFNAEQANRRHRAPTIGRRRAELGR